MPRRVVPIEDHTRFAAGWRLTLDRVPVELHPTLPPGAPPDPANGPDAIVVDVIRPRDLVSLGIAFTGCDLVAGDDEPPVVRPRDGADALMYVDHAFQHGFERAVYEQLAPKPDPNTGAQPPVDDPDPNDTTDPPGTLVTAPTGFRPARTSRLVFTVPNGFDIEFSTTGILAAMQDLTLVVHPLATPGDAPTVGRTRPGGLVITHVPPHILLGDGLVLELHDQGPVIATASRELLRDNPAPDTSTLSGRLEHQRNLRRARTVLARSTPTIAAGTRIPDTSIFRPGGGLVGRIPDDIVLPTQRRLSRPPTASETGIEAPYRLVISPSAEARFAHAPGPVEADDHHLHVELWHSRLAHAPTTEGGPPDEHNATRRIVRALWARDRDWVGTDWQSSDKDNDNSFSLSHTVDDTSTRGPGFRGSLDRFDRHMLVRQSTETWLGDDGPIVPVPVAADALWLSSLGAWLDLHGAWTTLPYSAVQMQSILSWDHVAPMGRDQYVRVVYPGYLYPFGHQTALVKLTERKMKTATNSVAGLYQRMFLVIGQRRRTHSGRDLPFQQVDIRPLVSPIIDPLSEVKGDSQVNWFWPRVAGARFNFTVDTLDTEGNPVRMHTPLMWVSEAFSSAANRADVDAAYLGDPSRRVSLDGQSVAFVPRQGDGADTELETSAIWLQGAAALGTSTPRMSAATVLVPAVQQVSRTGPIAIRYRNEYVAGGFGASDVGEVWAEVNVGGGGEAAASDPTTVLPQMKFGAGADAGSDKAGGFVAPDLPIRALSRATGPVGDAASAVSNDFDPAAFLAGALPKLFGLVELTDLIPSDTSIFPSVVTDTLGRIEQFARDVQRLVDEANAAIDEATKLVDRAQAKSAELQAKAQQAVAAAQQLAADAQAFLDAFVDLLDALPGLDLGDIGGQVGTVFDELDDLLAAVRALADLLPPQAGTTLRQLADALHAVADAGDLIQDIFDFVNGFDPATLEQGFSFEWKPQLQQWPATDPMFVLEPNNDNLVLAVRGRVSGNGTAEVTASAELRDFALVLFGAAPLIKVPFDHMFFKAGTTGKPEVDVVLGDIEFLGILSFVETIKDLIPFDGFSDPPFVEVSPAGATAGFTLELPSVAIGVFSLTNMSLGADVHVPFLGETVTVGFNFCSRERPFTLTVMCLGGGGWFLIRVAPNGLDVLEIGLEATASLSVDFGVASGSISAAVGLYMRLEGEGGSLTGYFRLRGEVDVLGLISASIELYMELFYDFDTGKMIGRASITVTVEVLIFSGTVTISAERQLAGSNGDPSFREILGAEDGTSPAWTTYCMAFAAEE